MQRVDGRTFHQFRDLQVNFGQTFGSCYVQLGHTVVYASTEATVDEPRVTRPSEGRFKVTINIGAGGKERWLRQLERAQPKEAVLTMRLVEKIVNRINVLDLESLCLVTGRLAWCISCKLVLLNFDGNLIEAASIATIASLMHFRRPDATVTPDGDLIVHSFEERNPIPLTLFHHPICVTFQFMDHTLLKKIMSENQEIIPEQHQDRVRKALKLAFCDPTEEEEDFLSNVLVICANTYREIVAIQSIGCLSLASYAKPLMSSCIDRAFERVKFVTDYLKSQLDKHNQSTSNPFERFGFREALNSGQLCIVKDYMRNPIFGPGNSFNFEPPVVDGIGEGGASKWIISNMDEEPDEDDDEVDEDEPEPSKNEPLPQPQPPPRTQTSYASRVKPEARTRVMPSVTTQKREIKVVPVASSQQPSSQQRTAKERNNQWVKVGNTNKPTNQSDSSKKRKRAKKQASARSNQPKVIVGLSSDEEEDVVQVSSEYRNK